MIGALVTRIKQGLRAPLLPWVLLGALLAAMGLREIIPAWPHPGTTSKWLIGLGLVLVFWLAWQSLAASKTMLDLRSQVGLANRRLKAVFLANQEFLAASDENEIVTVLLNQVLEQVGIAGVSFVPLDEHAQPMAALRKGTLPIEPVMTAWVEYLASPGVRDRCQDCEFSGSLVSGRPCPLLNRSFIDAQGVYCLPLQRGQQEFGILNLFLAGQDGVAILNEDAQAFLKILMDESSLALDGMRLRRRELAGLKQFQAVKQKSDLVAWLNNLLESARQIFDAELAVMVINGLGLDDSPLRLQCGEAASQTEILINSVQAKVLADGKPLIVSDLPDDAHPAAAPYSLMAVPLLDLQKNILGAVEVGNRQPQAFDQHHLALLQTLSWQVTWMMENVVNVAGLEYRTIVAERSRLAREIHDGLAQTLGFLKVLVAQMQNYLERNDLDRLQKNLGISYTALSEAYQDVRQAIDNLRLHPNEAGFEGWLSQVAQDFQELSGLEVVCNIQTGISLPLEIQAQLVRVVQEAFNNVRKHAGASQVCLECYASGQDLWLEVCDNGRGFSPDEVSVVSQHGLRGMRERAEFIGADFQVTSRPGNGASVRLRLPIIGLMTGEKAS